VTTKGNIDQFRQSFQEEARELVVDLEAALLLLNENRDDEELVGRIFRALHTIKGSGSMFGFEKLASFTHNLENAFDENRNGRFKINSELIDLTLAALDQIRAMIEDKRKRQSTSGSLIRVSDRRRADPFCRARSGCDRMVYSIRTRTGHDAVWRRPPASNS